MDRAVRMPMSSSVEKAAARINPDEKVRSWELVNELLRDHTEYGRQLGGRLLDTPGPETSDLRPVDEWLDGVMSLFDPERVPRLHGRLAILGLCRMDPALRDYLAPFGFLDALQSELKEPFDSLMRTPSPEAPSTPNQSATPRGETITPPPARLYAAGYISDSVDEKTRDLLDIESEVRNIAYMLSSKRVMPPLSLGLFGDWGSGKSFFMTKLQTYIDRIAHRAHEQERADGKVSEWCSRVLQIRFNAWHFSDANLWASLVTRIYDELHRELNDEVPSDKIIRERLDQEVKKAEGVVRQAQIQLTEAETRVNVASDTLEQAHQQRLTEETRLKTLVEDIGTLLKTDPRIKENLDQATRALGFPEAARSYSALEELDTDLKSFSGRLSAVTVSLFRSPWTLVVLALLVIVLPVAVSFILGQFSGTITEIGRRVIEISTFLFGLIAWLKVQVGKGFRIVESIENSMVRARQIREARFREDKTVKEAQRAVEQAQSEERAARQNLDQAQAELQRLKTELEELKPERKLHRLIEERSRSATYTQHLGIISLIRTDFEKISDLLRDMAADERDLKTMRPSIQRIILYIDDLDRCRPERVVEVLEAVHLLLAFKLFIVVVAVDPRWLRHSLAQHYPHTLSENGDVPATDYTVAPFSTPQDFLEKIFQIPFALRPIGQNGFQKLVTDLLKPLPAPAQPTSRNGETAAIQGDTRGAGPSGDSSRTPTASTAAGTSAGQPESTLTTQPFILMNPGQLEFREHEQKDVARLWRLFHTPRTVKRFINTYRLLRASLDPEELPDFEGTPEQPGEYQVALLLLALVSSAPNETEMFLYRLSEWLEQPDSKNLEKRWYWQDVLDALQSSLVKMDPDWKEIIADLDRITEHHFLHAFTRDTLRKWAWRVARYSFSVRPAHSLFETPETTPRPA